MREINQTSYSNVEANEISALARTNPEQLIAESEKYYFTQLATAVDKVIEGHYPIVLLSGPSASGKTTTAFNLRSQLEKRGIGARVLSMDDFFKGVAAYPLRENGEPDMESFETLDIALLNKTFEELAATGKALFPIFDFTAQAPSDKVRPITLNNGDVLIMEGIHALNPSILNKVDPKLVFRMYVSVRTKFLVKGEDLLRPPQIRLVRRMVRDYQFRSYAPVHTLDYWGHVLDSEKIYIDPYRDQVDFKMDTTIDYEVCVWRTLLEKKIRDTDESQVLHHDQMAEILYALEQFQQLEIDIIPQNSLLREFIGKTQ